MISVDGPVILLLSLAFRSFFDESYSSLIDKLDKTAQLKRAKTASGAIQYLDTNNPKAILITDEGLMTEENRPVLGKVVSYVRGGGLVIFGLHFPCFIDIDDIDKIFTENFGLPWQRGQYGRSEYQLNSSCSLPSGVVLNSLPAPYSMKVLQVKDARPHEKIFLPVTNPETQSLGFSPKYVNRAEAAVVGAKVGNGYLVYAGDVNPGEGSDKIILTLCGL